MYNILLSNVSTHMGENIMYDHRIRIFLNNVNAACQVRIKHITHLASGFYGNTNRWICLTH